jgi:hypothetical protein
MLGGRDTSNAFYGYNVYLPSILANPGLSRPPLVWFFGCRFWIPAGFGTSGNDDTQCTIRYSCTFTFRLQPFVCLDEQEQTFLFCIDNTIYELWFLLTHIESTLRACS